MESTTWNALRFPSMHNVHKLLGTRKLVLASQSPRRRELLTRAGVPFVVVSSDVDEVFLPGEPPEVGCERLAREKAIAVWRSRHERENEVIAGADTIVILDGKILGKPRDDEDAFRMLKALSSRTHRVCTSVALLVSFQSGEQAIHSALAEAKVTFGAFSDSRLWEYVRTGDSQDKAGAYGAQEAGAFLVDCIEGELDTVIGLPLARLDALASVALSGQVSQGE